MKLGSLFDGSGGFPLAGALCGIEPVWASEVEPYPIAVTRSCFPNMKHLGDISKINGTEIEPVDIITFGSPCQDLSVAGKRAGLKHEDNGDEETTRSGLFMEAVRIIKEMRDATNGEYPSFALWENVPGAFSSNKGEDFRIVLEELVKIVEPTAVMPAVPKSGWPYADSYRGDGWSLAYRVFDAQYWGVPQRRRRIHLVLDLRGERAREVLFEREGVRGDFAEGRAPWQAASADAEGSVGADGREGNSVITFEPGILRREGGHIYEGVAGTLRANAGDNQLAVACKTWDARGNGDGDICNTITGDHENRITDYTSVICLQGNGIDRADTAGCNGRGWKEDTCYTLNTIDRPAVAYLASGKESVGTLMASMATKQCLGDQEAFSGDYHIIEERDVVAIDRAAYNQGQNALYDPQFYTDGTVATLVARGPSAVAYKAVRYIVRRLTPTECARLQGFADRWGDIEEKTDFTDTEYQFWLDVRNTHAAINGKATKDYTKDQMVKWYNKLHTDSAEYKMWGNGIALPPALYCMQGIVEASV